MTSRHQQELRERVLAAAVVAPPAPWRRPAGAYTYLPVGGLLGVGFGTHPDDGRDLLLVVSTDGHGVVDTRDYGKLARDRDPDPDNALPAGDDLSVPGLGPLAGRRVRIAGLCGGGLHSVTEDGWSVDVAAPDWPSHRVLLSTNGGRYDGPPGTHWWHIFHAHYSQLRAAGFSPSGRSLVVATSSDITLLIRAP